MRRLYDVPVPLLSKNISVALFCSRIHLWRRTGFFFRTALWLTSIIKLYLDGGQKEEKDIDKEREKELAGW